LFLSTSEFDNQANVLKTEGEYDFIWFLFIFYMDLSESYTPVYNVPRVLFDRSLIISLSFFSHPCDGSLGSKACTLFPCDVS